MTLAEERKIELNKIAVDIYTDKIFVDLYIEANQRQRMLHLIFLPIALMETDRLQEIAKDLGMIYAYYENNVSNGSINGYPMFFSCGFLTLTEVGYVREKLKEIDVSMQALGLKSKFKNDESDE